MQVTPCQIPDVLLIQPQIFGDQRGFFLETFQRKRYQEQGIKANFIQDNHSRSQRGVLRGLHHQREHTQGKLLSVINGAVYDVAVDIRHGSPTFGQWVGITLDDQNRQQLYVPPGFAHGFCVLSESVDFVYKCTDYYDPASEMSIAWNDPDLNIDWPISAPVLSSKDKEKRIYLRDVPLEWLPVYSTV